MRSRHRILFLALAGAAAAATGTAAAAEDAPPPPPEFTINGGATLVSRLSLPRHLADRQARRRPGHRHARPQVRLLPDRLGLLGRRLRHASDAADQELDLIAGFTANGSARRLDTGVLYYVYPGAKTHLAGDPTSSDFFEPYSQHRPHDRPGHRQGHDQLCAEAEGAGARPDRAECTTISISPGTSRPRCRHPARADSPISATRSARPGCRSARAIPTGVSARPSPGTPSPLGIQYVDTDGTFITPSGKNASKGGVVGSLGVRSERGRFEPGPFRGGGKA